MSRSDPSFTGCQGRGLILRLRSRYCGHVCRSGEVADPEGVLLLLLLAQGTQAQDDGPLAWLLLLAGFVVILGIIVGTYWTLVHAARRRRSGWALAVALLGPFAAIVYWLVRPEAVPYSEAPRVSVPSQGEPSS